MSNSDTIQIFCLKLLKSEMFGCTLVLYALIPAQKETHMSDRQIALLTLWVDVAVGVLIAIDVYLHYKNSPRGGGG